MKDDEKKFYDQARISLQKLDPKSGELIVVNFPDDMHTAQMQSVAPLFQQLRDEFDCNIIMLSNGVKLETVSEDEMNMAGWYRKEQTTMH